MSVFTLLDELVVCFNTQSLPHSPQPCYLPLATEPQIASQPLRPARKLPPRLSASTGKPKTSHSPRPPARQRADYWQPADCQAG